MESKLITAALEYSERFGYPIIPVNPKDKKPLVKWLEFQQRKATIKEIESWWTKWPNAMIGGVTGQISHDFVIDIDNSQGDEVLSEYLPESLLTPTVTTPRGGKHLHFEHPEENITCKAGILHHVDYRGQGGFIILPPSCNSNGKQYQWIDGLSLVDLPRANLPSALLSYIKELAFVLYKGKNGNGEMLTNVDNELFTEGRRDEDLFSVANSLIKDHWSNTRASQVINMLARNCVPSFSPAEALEKVKSAIKRAEKRERNLTEDVRQWVLCQQNVNFLSTDVNKCLHLSTREEEKSLSVILGRLCEEGLIEKYGNKRGCYRTVEKDADEIDFMGVEEKIVDIAWPFEIEKWVKILPKNIIVVAGEVNAGKTAFLLNVCFMNMGRFKINYYSSEMGALELRDRLKKFEGNIQHWKDNINFRERSSNFADVIKPNDINIVDFLEITEEFYKVAGMIKEIYDKLKKGIAIIALQKNPKTDFGLGGLRSVEKARLYLAIENGIVKIVKGKNWASETNPNGIYRHFKLLSGAKFISIDGWKRD